MRISESDLRHLIREEAATTVKKSAEKKVASAADQLSDIKTLTRLVTKGTVKLDMGGGTSVKLKLPSISPALAQSALKGDKESVLTALKDVNFTLSHRGGGMRWTGKISSIADPERREISLGISGEI